MLAASVLQAEMRVSVLITQRLASHACTLDPGSPIKAEQLDQIASSSSNSSGTSTAQMDAPQINPPHPTPLLIIHSSQYSINPIYMIY